MSLAIYNEDELDALREIVNVAMGRAGNSLARLLDRFVQLPVPRIRMVDTGCIADTLREMVGSTGSLSAVRQAFYGRAFGEVIVLFEDQSFHEISEILSQDQADADDGADREEEHLLEVSNLLVGACVEGVAMQLESAVSYSPPSIIVRRGTPADVLGNKASWTNALLVEVNFRLEGRSFMSHVLVFWPDEALVVVHGAITRFLEAI